MSNDVRSSGPDGVFMIKIMEKDDDFNCKFNLKISEMDIIFGLLLQSVRDQINRYMSLLGFNLDLITCPTVMITP